MGRELGARSWVAENPGHCAGKLGLTAGSWALERNLIRGRGRCQDLILC